MRYSGGVYDIRKKCYSSFSGDTCPNSIVYNNVRTPFFLENKFIQFNTNTDLVCTNDQTIISGEDNTIFNIYLKKDKVITFIIDH